MLFSLCLIVFLGHIVAENPFFVRNMEENLHFSYIIPFLDEWHDTFGKTEYKDSLAPVNFWMKCIGNELRGYFHVEDTRAKPGHGKEADMPIAYAFQEKIKLYADDVPINYGVWMGGGDFRVDLSKKNYNSTVHITINDWMHYTIFIMSDCLPEYPKFLPTEEPKYIMNVFTQYFDNPHKLNKKAATGIANHFLYHRCALHLSHYEINVQREQVQYFMKNPVIAYAATNGWLTFIIKNSYLSAPIRVSGHAGSNCY
jgi:hypothetical protein